MSARAEIGIEADLRHIASELDECSAEEILRWAFNEYRSSITLACSFGGPTGMVLLDMAMRIDPSVPVFFIDTGLLFDETYDLVDKVEQRYGIDVKAFKTRLSVERQELTHGPALWNRDPDRCCGLRKVAPQREALRGYDAWITGLRRDQAPTRRATPVVAWDNKFGLVKVTPLATWTEKDVWRYIMAHDVPYNPLHDQGFPSLGCTNCTRAILPGEDLRAGRWSGLTKIECGLHTSA